VRGARAEGGGAPAWGGAGGIRYTPAMPTVRTLWVALALGAAGGPAGADGVRIVTWNVSLYAGGRVGAIHTSVYGEFAGRSLAPDAILLQEMVSAGAVEQLVAGLNSAPGSPGDWAMAPFVDGNDSDNCLVYRTSKLGLMDAVVVARGGPAPNHPRDVNRYDVRLAGYASDEGVISLYSSHMKAGSSGSDQERRLLEAGRIREDAAGLPAGRHFVLGGDLNIQSSDQDAYQELVGPGDGLGRFGDPIGTPGEWNNDRAFRFVHTQDPAGAGGMDDRHDQLLISATLADQDGCEYAGAAGAPFSTETWDDPAHSYRVWGNDGSSFDLELRSEGNTMVGPEIADALKAMCAGSGHLPVLLEVRVPARAAADGVVDFGVVIAGEPASATLTVGNGGDAALWGERGIGELRYTLEAPRPFAVNAGPHEDGAGGTLNAHEVRLDTAEPGVFEAALLVRSNDPEARVLEVVVRAEVVGACGGDWDGDGAINTLDVLAFLNDWSSRDPRADLDGDGEVNTLDVLRFLNLWTGC